MRSTSEKCQRREERDDKVILSLYAHHLTALLFVDASIHFAAMVGAVMLWSQYVVSYLDTRSAFEKILLLTGRAFFALELIFIGANIFKSVLCFCRPAVGLQTGRTLGEIYLITAKRRGMSCCHVWVSS